MSCNTGEGLGSSLLPATATSLKNTRQGGTLPVGVHSHTFFLLSGEQKNKKNSLATSNRKGTLITPDATVADYTLLS